MNCVQQNTNDCALCVLRNIEMAIKLHSEFATNFRRRAFKQKIRNYYHRDSATILRKEIVTLLSTLSGIRFLQLEDRWIEPKIVRKRTMSTNKSTKKGKTIKDYFS